MADNNHSSRILSFDVASQRTRAGYHCIRVAGSPRPFDLIAWKGEKILFILLKRSRNAGISRYKDDICRIADLVQTKTLPGAEHLWIYRSSCWVRYQIMPGGAIPARWEAQV